ncbi:UNVERIFIED_CONTAM: protein NETWORKED 1A [Sesamum radiatum]|uniref:Protein NETWORKED 1A n=1 Tax=Sesamum radiatum TaxID=300843 RepID=A0AAW2S7X2_SESRA
MSNLSLRVEADNLAKKIAMKDQELSEKQEELENLQTCLQGEHLRHAQIEATLQTLQNLHSQSQDDQRAIALELRNVLQMLKNMEASKHVLEEEMQQEILHLKEEIQGLNKSYQALVEQVEAAGLKPQCLGTSMKSLQTENSKLRQLHEQDSYEKEIMLKRLESMQQLLKKKVSAESSLSDLNSELESSREKVKTLQESCQFLHGEKVTLIAEKASLLSQLQAITENMHKLLEKNAVLENSLSTAKVELEGLREKSKGLQEICELLKNERSYLLTERGSLALKLENVERKLESLKICGAGEKYADLEKEKEAAYCQVEELKVSLSVEKQERTSTKFQSETRFAGLETRFISCKNISDEEEGI